MDAGEAVDVMIVSLGSTAGLRRADEELREALGRAGASVAVARARPPAAIRTMMLTDLAWARAARAAADEMLAGRYAISARAVIYSSTTAALLWRRPGAIRFDATAAGNRPGRHGLWQRPLERRRLRQAPLLLPWSEGGLREAPAAARAGGDALVLPVAVEPSGPAQATPGGTRDIAAVTYAANPAKKGLARVLSAWRRVRGRRRAPGSGEELLVAGTSEQALARAGLTCAREPGIRVVGSLPPEEFRALLRRARVLVSAPTREDYGIVQLEALADGCQLVTTAAPGPYAALPIARRLDGRLVGEDLASGLLAALDHPLADYAPRARRALLPFSRHATDRIVREELLPRLLG
jgi:Glycosyl transferases group 1